MPRPKHPMRQPATPRKCGGKNCYPSKRVAETAAKEQEMLCHHENLRLNIYHCTVCGQWHLTRRRDHENGEFDEKRYM